MKQLLYVSAASLSLIAGIAYADGEKQENRETIVVKGSRIVKYLPGALKTDIIRTEVVTAAQIEAVNATSINQAVDKNPGISVQTECSICNVRNVTLNNMPGRFTTLMIDSVPLFSSLSTSYGLDSVNVAGVKSIDISRGAGASLIAPEALSGVVNIITKRPLDKEISATLEGGDYNSNTFSVFGALPFEGGAITASALATKHDSVDETGAGISQFTGYDRKIYGLALFLEPNGWLSKSRLDYVDEKRSGGAIGDDYAAIAASESGNPFDWTKLGASQINGWDAPDGSGFVEYADGRGGFSEIIFTKRHSVISTLEKTFDFGTLRFAGGYAHNDQESYYEKANYNAEGDQYYLETSFKKPVFDGVATIGLNYRFEDLVSVGNDANKVENNGIDNYEYKTPGALFNFISHLWTKN
ncbi:MAG: TonB-dependent receptor plug domain-containing protein [Proteobacteria bacterium]|nr:TonB-dependent receptor plug domain-containing protein [Pseudomonadota bacterium]